MEIRKILVPLNGRCGPQDLTSLDVLALKASLKVAQRLEARVEVLSVGHPHAQEMLGLIDWMPDYGMDAILGELERQGEARQRNARTSYEAHVAPQIGVDGLQASFVEMEGDTRAKVAAAGRLSDLIVIASSQALWERPFRPILDAALRETARPILVVPEAMPDTVGEHVTVAWNDSLEAARAISGAMPVLRRASSVSVLTCGGEGEGKDPASLDAVIDYLALHGVNAKGTEIVAQHRRPASEIIDAALAQGSDLLVLGSVIHSHAYNLVYGSLTEEVLKAPRLSAYLVP